MSRGPTPPAQTFHATTICVDGHAVMLTGPSGSGKSSLALQLIGLGAQLIGDDLTRLERRDATLIACAPDTLQGVIEARGLGLIHVPFCAQAPLRLIVDMAEDETQRLPRSPRFTTVLDCPVELVKRVDAPYFASAILNILRYGRAAESN